MLLFAKIIALAGLFLGSLEDLRTREVPDWLSFSMIFLGVGSALIFSISNRDHSIILSSLTGLVVCVALAYLMFYTGQWGGGDAKLLMGMGALIGLDLVNMRGVPLLLVFILNIFLVGAAYGMLWSFAMALKNWEKFSGHFRKKLYSDDITRMRKLNLVISLLLLIGIILLPLRFKIVLFALFLFMFATLYLWIFIKSVEECCMIKEIKVKELVEGDWLVREVKVGGRRIAGPGDLGITKDQIEKLKNSKVKKVVVKEGIPFVPSFLLGFIATLIWGNWLTLLV